jgi:Gpi18-like mannosyltransferase
MNPVRRLFQSEVGYVIGLFLVAFLLRMFIATSVYGTEDVYSWEMVGQALANGQNPYQATHVLRWPPLWMITVFFAQHLSDRIHIDFATLIKVPPILADIAIAVTIYYYFARLRKDSRRGRLWAGLYAVNPISILAVVAHGQFDSIPTLFVLLSLYFLESGTREASLPFSSICLGLAIFAKTWPVLLLPLFIAHVPGLRSKVAFLITALLPYLLSVATLYVLTPNDILHKVVLYRSVTGWWGFTSFYSVVPSAVTGLILDLSSRFGIFVLLAAMVGLAYQYHRLRRDRHVAFLEALIGGILLFYVLTPGLGTQYLAWIVPFAVIYADTSRFARYFLVLVSLELAIEYVFRPYICSLLEWIAPVPSLRSECFRAVYGTPIDKAITNVLRWPVWLSCGFFLARILRGWRRPVAEGALSPSD